MNVKNTHVQHYYPQVNQPGGDPDTCLLKSSRRPSDLPRLRDCRRLDCFPGWFRRWPCAVAGRLPLQGQADVEELKPDLGLTPVPPLHTSRLWDPKERRRDPKAGAVSMAASAGSGTQGCPTQAGSGRQRLGVGAARPRAAGGRSG